MAAGACIPSAQVDRNTGVHRKTTVFLEQHPSTGLHVTNVMAGRPKRFSFHGRRSSRITRSTAAAERGSQQTLLPAPLPQLQALPLSPRRTGYSADKRIPATRATLIP